MHTYTTFSPRKDPAPMHPLITAQLKPMLRRQSDDLSDTVQGLTRAAWKLISAFDRAEAWEDDELGMRSKPRTASR